MKIENYRKFYNQNRLAYTLKTGKVFKRRELHKRLVYLAKQTFHYKYSSSNTIEEENFNRISNITLILKDKDEQINSILEIFKKYILGSELLKCYIVGAVTSYDATELNIRIKYNRNNIDWVSMDEELINNHYDNISIHKEYKIPYIVETRKKWWENLNLNLNLK